MEIRTASRPGGEGIQDAVGMSALALRLHAMSASLFRLAPGLAARAANAGQVADYIRWQDDAFTARPELFTRREELWARLADEVDPDRSLFVIELGVAWGYATSQWIDLLGSRDFDWHGFDLFTGLPRAWRDLPAGHFDADGKPPAINDERISWHIGDTHETLPQLSLTDSRDSQWLVLFDLDLYEPTLAAWNLLQPHLEPGDLLYFDEAVDADERRVLNEQVLAEIAVSPVGTTTNSLALKVSGT